VIPIEVRLLMAWATVKTAEVKSQRNERGDVLQKVIISAIMCATALAICYTLAAKFKAKADTISAE
jgi:hypothetical protein